MKLKDRINKIGSNWPVEKTYLFVRALAGFAFLIAIIAIINIYIKLAA